MIKKQVETSRLRRQIAELREESSDVTYTRLGNKYVFLAVVLDLFLRRIVSWRLEERPNAGLATATLRQAFSSRQPTENLLFHTDRGRMSVLEDPGAAEPIQGAAQHEPAGTM